MYKRGQVTVFLTLGILFLAVFGVVFFIVQKNTTQPLEENEHLPLSLRVESTQQFIEQCLEQSLRDAIAFSSYQGGYYRTPAPYFEFAFFDISYYFDQSILSVPSRENVERQLSLFIEDDINSCWDGFHQFPWNVTVGKMNVSTTITERKVISQLEVPVRIFIGQEQAELNTFQVEAPTELGQALLLRDRILEEQASYPEYVRMSELVRLGEENKVTIELTRTDTTVLYNLHYTNSTFSREGYNYLFAMSYNWSTEETIE